MAATGLSRNAAFECLMICRVSQKAM
jgi:hypothetical protein